MPLIHCLMLQRWDEGRIQVVVLVLDLSFIWGGGQIPLCRTNIKIEQIVYYPTKKLSLPKRRIFAFVTPHPILTFNDIQM